MNAISQAENKRRNTVHPLSCLQANCTHDWFLTSSKAEGKRIKMF